MLLTAVTAATPQKPPLPSVAAFSDTVQPFLMKNRHTCHNPKLSTAGLNLVEAHPFEDRVWRNASQRFAAPGTVRRRDRNHWLRTEFSREDKLVGPDVRCCFGKGIFLT
jgi:hypothetical protein